MATPKKKAPTRRRSTRTSPRARAKEAKKEAAQARLVAAFEECGGNVTRACEIAGVARRTAYEWRDAQSEFAAAWDRGVDRGADVLEDEARRRAYEGWEEPVFHRGSIVGYVRKYSDPLIIFLLRGLRPERYSRRALDPPPAAGEEVERAKRHADLVRQMLTTLPRAESK